MFISALASLLCTIAAGSGCSSRGDTTIETHVIDLRSARQINSMFLEEGETPTWNLRIASQKTVFADFTNTGFDHLEQQIINSKIPADANQYEIFVRSRDRVLATNVVSIANDSNPEIWKSHCDSKVSTRIFESKIFICDFKGRSVLSALQILKPPGVISEQ